VAASRQRAVLPPPGALAALAALALGWLVLLALYLAWGPGHVASRDTFLYLGLMVGSGLLTIARAVLVARDRTAWALLGTAMLVSALGDLTYSLAVVTQDPEPFPSIADPLYLAYYPLCLAALVIFVRARVGDVVTAVWRDAATIALATGALIGALFLTPVSAGLEGTTAAVLVGAAYPLADTALLLVSVLGLVLLGSRSARALIWIGASMAVGAVADLVYWDLVAGGTYEEGRWVDAAWPLAGILMAVGAWAQTTGWAHRVATSRALLLVPGVSLVAATTTLAYGAVRPVPLVTVVLAVAALLGVLGRLNGTVRHTLLMMDARREATTDELTGLPNRRGFTAGVDATLDNGGATRGAVLVLADIDEFREVNDSLGHHAGDEMLRAVTGRLRTTASVPGTVLGRLGGDEFAILLSDARATDGIAFAERLAGALSTPFQIEGTRVAATVSVGISCAPQDGSTMSDLLRRADIAMHRAKSERLGFAVFDNAVDLAGEDRLQRVAELRSAIEGGQLVLHYQPKIRLDDGAVVGVEALVRWDRPGHGLVYPDAFLPLVARAGLTRILTDAVLAEAVRQSVAWRAAGIDLPVAVNIPPDVLIDESFPDHVAAMLDGYYLPGSTLQVEITEEALLRDRDRAQAVLERLRALGVQASIDDYGTGYSSLVYLRELVVDEVKIDRSFVVPMLLDERSSSIVRSTIDLAHALGLRVVAEGIEEPEVAMMLAQYGCDLAQGYHWSRPLPAEVLEVWLRSHQQKPTVTVTTQRNGAADLPALR